MKHLIALTLAAVLCGCGSDNETTTPATAGASDRDVCEATARCIFGAEPEADAFSDECVAEGVFAGAPAGCRECLIDLSCPNLEAAIEGDATAQAMCPAC